MANIKVVGDRCIIDDPLYQWDSNQILTIYGLSLPSIPEIHFANVAMECAIVRQAEMNDAGIISVQVPNSMLQQPYLISVYVCKYDGDTFESLYQMDIPIKKRKKPADYSFVDDSDEIYSYNALNNRLTNVLATCLARYDEINTKYEQVNEKYVQAVDKVLESETALRQATKDYTSAKTVYDNAAGILEDCQTATEECRQIVKEASDGLGSKENKSIFRQTVLLASNWDLVAKTYSFEEIYPAELYDIEVQPDYICTVDQVEAWYAAILLGRIDVNVLTAKGDIPELDIPIILKLTPKSSHTPEVREVMLLTGEKDTGWYVEIDEQNKNIQNIVDSKEALTDGKYALKIL
ncbi:hypothetical protein AALA22_10745 [Anaerovoracaceae bacterium 41-7]|uniref:hypothetical protein n=1 Tax=Emergencia sp. JLR.KK010 TaxID=3114296 RepID=UPI0030CC5679